MPGDDQVQEPGRVAVDVLGTTIEVEGEVLCEQTPVAACAAFGACPAYAAWRARLGTWGMRA